MHHIVQLIPADGWAVELTPGGDLSARRAMPLVAWALVSDPDGSQRVIGLVQRKGEIVPAADLVSEGDALDYYRIPPRIPGSHHVTIHRDDY